HFGSTLESGEVPCRRRASGGIKPGELAAVPNQSKQIAAESVAARLEDSERDRGRERCVERVAAGAQRGNPCLRGERLRRGDNIAGEDGLPSRRGGQVPFHLSASDITSRLRRTPPRESCEIAARR